MTLIKKGFVYDFWFAGIVLYHNNNILYKWKVELSISNGYLVLVFHENAFGYLHDITTMSA